ncbi:MAG: TIGR02647 family protein [Methylococcaceae bacterium]|nr:TIGR02647 family protein [Methylococcaceae bacterium]
MSLTTELIEELRILSHYNLDSFQEGIKVHGSANNESIAAAKRLFEKGLTSQADGGYLTDLGIESAEHIQAALTILSSR